jgi:hypothetical protein
MESRMEVGRSTKYLKEDQKYRTKYKKYREE